MLDLKKQLVDTQPNFSWKYQMKKSLVEMNLRIKILEQTGNVDCVTRTKFRRTKLEKRIKETFPNA